MSARDFKLSNAKYADVLSCLKTSGNMELIIVESSSGIMIENMMHTVEDSLKLLECSISSLRKEAVSNKHASISTFKKPKAK